MQYISSSQNPRIKSLKALATQAKARRESDATILEGVHLTQAYLEAGLRPEVCVVGKGDLNDLEVSLILKKCQTLSVEILTVPSSLFRSFSSVRNGIGIMFLINTPQLEVQRTLQLDAVLLDGIQDPGNLGAILRTAAAANIDEVFCSVDTTAAWSPKVLRAGMGAHFGLKIYEQVDLGEIINQAEIPVYATTLEATTTIYEADLIAKSAWLVGNEGQGVSRALLKSNVSQVIIPQSPDVESLNVAAATAVCLFEQLRQRQYR